MLFSGSAGTWTEVCSEFPGSVVKWLSEGLSDVVRHGNI